MRRLLDLICMLGVGCAASDDGSTGTATGSTGPGAGSSSTGTTDTPTTGAADTSTTSGTSTTGTTDTPTSDTTADTGFKPLCGDGVLTDDEICDDGNLTPEDGCDACMPAPKVLWSRFFDGPDHEQDSASAVAFTPDGGLYVAGQQGDADGLGDIVIRKLDPEGTLLWEHLFAGPGGQRDYGSAVAVTDDGGAVVAGRISVVGDGMTTSPWARRYTADGEVAWTFSEDAPASGTSYVSDLVIAGDAVYMVGTETIDVALWQAVVRRLDIVTGIEIWQQQYVGEGPWGAGANTIIVVEDELLVGGYTGTAAEEASAVLQRWTTAGTLVSTVSWSDPAWPFNFAVSAALLPDGKIGLAVQGSKGSEGAAFLVMFADDGAVLWAEPLAEDWAARVGDVAVDAMDRLLVVGYGQHPTYSLTGFFGVYAADGAVEMFGPLRGPEGFGQLSGLAVHSSGIAVVGNHSTAGNSDQWIAKLAP